MDSEGGLHSTMALVAERMRRVALAAAAAVESSFWSRASPFARSKEGVIARCVASVDASAPAAAGFEGSHRVGESSERKGSTCAVHGGNVEDSGGKRNGQFGSFSFLGSNLNHVSGQAPEAGHQRLAPALLHNLRVSFGVPAQRRGITTLPHLGGVAAPAIREERVGLYGYDGLMDAQEFRVLVREAIEISEGIIHDIRHAVPSVAIVKGLDDISNTVCTVLDAAELCRNTHPDRWVFFFLPFPYSCFTFFAFSLPVLFTITF